jgi:predicted metal-dependent phosphoesterase TrpH
MASDLWSVDLHSHTTYSDGSQSPAGLVRLAKANGVRVLSVTDHDHTGGIDEALAVGAQDGVEIIPGIELSVSHAEFEDIHILAYYFAWHAPRLLEQLEAFRLARETRAERILERINAKLAARGRAPIAYDSVKARVKGAFGRPHIAGLLVERGYVPDMNSAFKDYLIPCNVPKYSMSATEALGLIRQARGLSAVAHPRLITPERVRLRQVIHELRACGLDGIEAYHSDHGPEDRLYFIQLANELGMMIAGGSDYHGFKPPAGHTDGGGKLGSLQLPYSIAVQLRRAYLARYPMALLLLQWPTAPAAAMRRALGAQYELASVGMSHGEPLAQRMAGMSTSPGSLVVDLPAVDNAELEAMIAEGKEQGLECVGVPWETASAGEHRGLHRTTKVSLQRFRRTAIERLAHELVHEAILVQLQ